MRVTCPKCQFKGLVDHGKSTARIRVICVQCATTFDAVITDDGAKAALPSPNGMPSLKEIASQDFRLLQANSQDFDLLPVASQPPRMFYETREPTSLGETALLAPPKHLLPPPPPEMIAAPPVEIIDEPQMVEVIEPQVVEEVEFRQVEEDEVRAEDAFADEWDNVDVVESADAADKAAPVSFGFNEPLAPPVVVASASPGVPEANSFEFSRATKSPAPSPDKYKLGVRLMRVSPLWLLVCGLGLVSTMVFFNWIKKPTAAADDVTINLAPLRNGATNESVAPIQSLSPETTTTLAPAPEPVVAEQPPAPVVAPIERKSVVEPTVRSAGRFTVQIGSFKEAAQAEKIVAELQAGGLEARAEQTELPKRGIWHRVYAGQFGDREEATRYAAQLRSKGLAQNTIVAEVEAR